MRIRTIKPEFFLHDGLFDLERSTNLPIRLAFVGLWCAADREGRFKWEPRKLGIQILPYDGINFSDILDSLETGGFVVRYGESDEFGAIPSFSSHQCVNIREAKSHLPAVDEAHVHARAFTGEECAPVPYQYRGVNIQPKLRETVFARDGRTCVRCKATEDLTVDHIFPQSIGGTHAITNLRTLCRPCNSGRPVQGEGLIEDLKKDGLTLDDMQRMCTHVHARGEGKGKEQGKEGKGMDTISGGDSEFELVSEAVEIIERHYLPDGWKKMNEKERGLTRVNFNTPEMINVGRLMGRRESTLWTVAEALALKAISPHPDEIESMERYYLANIEKAEDYRRRDLITLLNNWNGELDRARIFKTNN